MPGLDKTVLDSVDHNLLLRRVRRDVRSDFIFAPHYNSIFVHAADELWARTYEQLKSGIYEPELPLTIAVPKPGGFVRPGSILQPIDRLVYQGLAEFAAPILESQLDRSRTFSHILAPTSSDEMFEPERACWESLQATVTQLAKTGGYFVKADVANYFERIPQHHLINLMRASGCLPEVVKLLEEILLAFQERDSFGIIQGIFPSDLLGNFYLSDLDSYCDIHGIPSARFVDDMYLHYKSEVDAVKGLMKLCSQLHQEGLHLNEAKSGIRSASALIKDETALDRLFAQAASEVEQEDEEHEEDEEAEFIYGFAVEWEGSAEEDDEQNDKEDHEEDEHEKTKSNRLKAVVSLYQSIAKYPKHSDKIERFSLPVLQAERSDVGVGRALSGVIDRPYLARVYLSYLSTFVSDSKEIRGALEQAIASPKLVSDYQRMYILAALMGAKEGDKNTVNLALQWLSNSQVCQEVRAVAAIFSAKFGTPQQRRAVRLAYEKEASPYVRAAILYTSRYFTSIERKACIQAWAGHSIVNTLVAQAVRAVTRGGKRG